MIRATTIEDLAGLATADKPAIARFIQERGRLAAVHLAIDLVPLTAGVAHGALARTGIRSVVETWLAGQLEGDANTLVMNLKALHRLTLERLAEHESLCARAELALGHQIAAPPSLETVRAGLRMLEPFAGIDERALLRESVARVSQRPAAGEPAPAPAVATGA